LADGGFGAMERLTGDEFYATIPEHLTLRQRIQLHREHKFYEWCRAIGIITMLIGAGLIAGGCQ
jgi:uncharacterized membrane protein YkgB